MSGIGQKAIYPSRCLGVNMSARPACCPPIPPHASPPHASPIRVIFLTLSITPGPEISRTRDALEVAVSLVPGGTTRPGRKLPVQGLAELNKRFAVVRWDGKVWIAERTSEETFRLLRTTAFHAMLANRFVSLKPGTPPARRLSKCWYEWEGRRECFSEQDAVRAFMLDEKFSCAA